MVTFDAVVQDFHVCLTEHLVVEFLGDDVWEHLLAIPVTCITTINERTIVNKVLLAP